MGTSSNISRRKFLRTTTAAAIGGATLGSPMLARAIQQAPGQKKRFALVGTGVRGVSMYGRTMLQRFGDYVELVGLCDQNPGRVAYAQQYVGTEAPTFTNLAQMLETTQPEWLMVTVWDWRHHEAIITALEHGVNVIVEKPITIDEVKAQAILDAHRRFGNRVVVAHNYRYSPHRAALKDMIMQGTIGEVTSVDFQWFLSHGHLQQYMQRWHGHVENGGSLWVHKASHHFDLVNWWVDSEPVEVFAMGSLDTFGRAGPFRGVNCRNCAHTQECNYYFNILNDQHLTRLYVENEQHDGYIRDNCVFRESINIWDKHSAVVRYANGAFLNYSLTGTSGYEGLWVAIDGTRGRIEGRESGSPGLTEHEWIVSVRGQPQERVRIAFGAGGHFGGDNALMDRLFRDMEQPDPLHQRASSREGVMAVLPGIAARKSIATGMPVRIAGLTDLVPQVRRPPLDEGSPSA
ncbi:MAG TPA: Gfo/Idh/MocA family oxidoreductase [Longimicrobiales bacterium]|nr:Gfo/Idh/MocA family oxidoreductase [Longimicrobiales bacterium]